MKNLKINKNKIKAILGAIILTTNLTACSFTQNKEKEVYTLEESELSTNNVQYIFVGEELVPISKIRLMDTKGNIITKVDGVLVNDQLMAINNPIEIKFANDIESVLIDNKFLPVSEFSLVNVDTLEKIENIKGVFVDNQFIEYTGSKVITPEVFNAKVEELYNYFINQGLKVTKQQVECFVMVYNVDQITYCFKNQLIDKYYENNRANMDSMFTAQSCSTDEEKRQFIMMQMLTEAAKVTSAFMTENTHRYCARGLGWDQLMMFSNVVIDETEKAKVIAIENRVRDITLSVGNKQQLNSLTSSLLNDLLDAKEEAFYFDSGVGYGVMNFPIYFIRANLGSKLNSENNELLKYMKTTADDADHYYNNCLTTAFLNRIKYLLFESYQNENNKTLTK